MGQYSNTKISLSECREIIKRTRDNKDNFKILNFQQTRLKEFSGFLGEHSKLIIQIQNDSNIEENYTFFVKSLPEVPSQRTFLEEINGGMKENHFFTKYCSLLKTLSIKILDCVIPACYLVTEESFVFEDLDTRGYKSLSSRTPLTVDLVKAALTSFAKLHASGLILEELTSCRLTQKFKEEFKETIYSDEIESSRNYVNSCKLGIEALIEISSPGQMSKEVFLNKAREDIQRQMLIAKPNCKFRNTFCHGDQWIKNFMFKFGNTVNCVLVDFQTYRYGPPAQDVMCFLHLVTNRATRDENLASFLQHYYQQLRQSLEFFGLTDIIPWNEFLESCRYFKTFALIQQIMHNITVILRNDIATELFSNQEKAKDVMFGNGRLNFIRETYEKDPLYKQMHYEAIEELKELYENKLLGFLYREEN